MRGRCPGLCGQPSGARWPCGLGHRVMPFLEETMAVSSWRRRVQGHLVKPECLGAAGQSRQGWGGPDPRSGETGWGYGVGAGPGVSQPRGKATLRPPPSRGCSGLLEPRPRGCSAVLGPGLWSPLTTCVWGNRWLLASASPL